MSLRPFVPARRIPETRVPGTRLPATHLPEVSGHRRRPRTRPRPAARRGLAPLLLWAGIVLWTVPAPSVADPLSWTLIDRSCPPPPGSVAVACGAQGTFLFGDPGPLSCVPLATNQEDVRIYPEPVDAIPEDAQNLPDPTPPEPPPYHPPVHPDWILPCAGGSCFDPPGGDLGAAPWAAVVDWDSWHGWTTGWTVKTLSGLATHLFALESSPLEGPVGDAHVLSALCEILELSTAPSATPPPSVVNLSFGRLPEVDQNLEPDVPCDPLRLTCQLRSVLDRLTATTAVVASAGNHGALLFPAGYPPVIAVGSLDLSDFVIRGATDRSWETPAQVDALMPGYGLCLEHGGDGDESELWPAPAGSSYAAGIFSGWLADVLARGSLAAPPSAEWSPIWSNETSCFQIAGATAPCNPKVERLFDRILGIDPTSCWGALPDEQILVLEEPLEPITGSFDPPSLDRWVALRHRPAPEANYCVPCVTGGGGGGASATWRSAPLGDPEGLLPPAPEPPPAPWVTLDLSAAVPNATQGLALRAVYLRFSGQLHPLASDFGLPDPDLDTLSEGGFLGIRFLDPGLAEDGAQPSLVYLLCDAVDSADCFWTSTPILLTGASPLD